MKHILFFITHKTLDREHCELSFKSIQNQVSTQMIFDVMYIYNTHQQEFPNEIVVDLYKEYGLEKFAPTLRIFNYDENSHKSLGQDIENIISYVAKHYELEDRILFLKSDCVLSKNYFQDIFDLPQDRPVYFTAPFVCAKSRVDNDRILEYTMRDIFVPSDDITFFTEDRHGPENSDLVHRKDVAITDASILFFACYVIGDWSCHLISAGLFHLLAIGKQSWGGVGLQGLEPYFVETGRSFVVHKYHDIKSENRSEDRWGPVHTWLNS